MAHKMQQTQTHPPRKIYILSQLAFLAGFFFASFSNDISSFQFPIHFSWTFGWRHCLGQFGRTLGLGLCRHCGRHGLSGLHGPDGPQPRRAHGFCGPRPFHMFRRGRLLWRWMAVAPSWKFGHKNAM